MKHPTLRHFRKGERLSALEYNKLVGTVSANAGSLHIQGYADSTGFHTRRLPSTAVAEVRGAKIQAGGVPSNTTGPFTCKLLDWEGNEVGDTIDVYPRDHLGTNDLDGAVRPAFSAADEMSIYKDLDNKWYTTFVFEDEVVGVEVRSAKIQTGGVPSNNTGPFTCKLLDAGGDETGGTISVYPREHLGTNNLNSTDVHPDYAAADIIPIWKDLDDVWYTTNAFEDTIDSVRTAP